MANKEKAKSILRLVDDCVDRSHGYVNQEMITVAGLRGQLAEAERIENDNNDVGTWASPSLKITDQISIANMKLADYQKHLAEWLEVRQFAIDTFLTPLNKEG